MKWTICRVINYSNLNLTQFPSSDVCGIFSVNVVRNNTTNFTLEIYVQSYNEILLSKYFDLGKCVFSVIIWTVVIILRWTIVSHQYDLLYNNKVNFWFRSETSFLLSMKKRATVGFKIKIPQSYIKEILTAILFIAAIWTVGIVVTHPCQWHTLTRYRPTGEFVCATHLLTCSKNKLLL